MFAQFDPIAALAQDFLRQFQTPTLAFLIGGMVLGACSSRLHLPKAAVDVIVFILLVKVGLSGGMALRSADLVEIAVPAALAVLAGITIVLLGGAILRRMRGVGLSDAMATAGLFGAVSASTLAAAMAHLDAQNIAYEGFIGALYPFMDLAALLTAIMVVKLAQARAEMRAGAAIVMGARAPLPQGMLRDILTDTLRSPAISALILGLAIGLMARPEAVYSGFYAPLFSGLLSMLMLVMGLEAWARLGELKGVAHGYAIYALIGPFVNGAIGLGLGLIAHHLTGFSVGGVALLAVMAASSSDISGPPTLRAALPCANPSAYIGASTGIGTPIALLSIPLWIALAQMLTAQ